MVFRGPHGPHAPFSVSAFLLPPACVQFPPRVVTRYFRNLAIKWKMDDYEKEMEHVAAINARISNLSIKSPPLQYKSRRQFLKNLSTSLIEQHMKSRSEL